MIDFQAIEPLSVVIVPVASARYSDWCIVHLARAPRNFRISFPIGIRFLTPGAVSYTSLLPRSQ